MLIEPSLFNPGEIMNPEGIFAKYIANVFAYLKHEGPDEVFMEEIESRIGPHGIPEQGKDDFRRSITALIGHVGAEITWPEGQLADPVIVWHGDRINWEIETSLKEAIELYLEAQGNP